MVYGANANAVSHKPRYIMPQYAMPFATKSGIDEQCLLEPDTSASLDAGGVCRGRNTLHLLLRRVLLLLLRSEAGLLRALA
jgi:hypothetical protein